MLNINERYKAEKLCNQTVVYQIIMKGPFRDGGAHFKLGGLENERQRGMFVGGLGTSFPRNFLYPEARKWHF